MKSSEDLFPLSVSERGLGGEVCGDAAQTSPPGPLPEAERGERQSVKPVRFIMVGGFLGAGKTTTLARLARHYMSLGQRVGLVTNDQAQDLVDTTSLRAQGFAVQEVPGACFCCKFDELVERASAWDENERPDVLLAEPVGSCTDLVATVIQPLRGLYAGRFKVAPYSVLFKPSHGLKILRDEGSGFSPKAAYIFRKQLEEADAIVINRADELSPTDLAELKERLAEQFPGTPVLVVSAKTGVGFDAYEQLLAQDGAFGRKLPRYRSANSTRSKILQAL